MTQLVFYTNPRSRGAVVRWMLEEVGRPYETVILGYGPPMKAPEYLAINPMGKVPALRAGETVVTEAAAICAFLADAFPEAGLAPAPTDPARGTYLRWLFFGAGPFEAAATNRALGFEPPPEKRAMVGYGSYDDVVAALEGAVDGRAFIAGDRFSAADVYCGSQILWGLQFGTLPSRPAFEAYAEGLRARDAYRRAQEADAAAAAAP